MKAVLVIEGLGNDVILSNCFVNYEVLEMLQKRSQFVADYREVLNVVCSPMKRLPLKRFMKKGFSESEYVRGWNDCLDAITGETE